jgi:hypothetical protein
MTDQEIYDATVQIAVTAAKVTTRDQITRASWLPFALLYEQMIRRKEIQPMSSLPKDEKLKYWNQTQGVNFVTNELFKRKIICQALYVFDLLTNSL